MRFIYPRTREREVAWKLSALVLVSCMLISPFVMLIFDKSDWWGFQEVCAPPTPSLHTPPRVLTLNLPTVALGLLPSP